MKLLTRHLLIGTAVLSLLAFFYAKTNRVAVRDHEQLNLQLRRFQQLDAAFDQDVLKARFRLLQDYDGFAGQLEEMNRIVVQLSVIPSFVPEAARAALRSQVNELAALVKRKGELIEIFKSQNAVLDNSLHYLPAAGSDWIRLAATNESSREMVGPLDELMREVLVFHRNAGGEQAPAIQTSLDLLNDWAARHRWAPQAETLVTLLAHARSILDRGPRVGTVTAELVSLPIGKRSEDLLRLHEDHFSRALSVSRLYGLGLQGLCVLLVIGIAYTIYALNAANRQLEARVSARTEELCARNRELHLEVAERKQAETDLAGSLSMLRATLEASVDGILVVDRQGQIASFNNRFVRMWRLSPEALSAGDDRSRLAEALPQLVDPDGFLARVRHLYAHPEMESHDLIEFKDGRVFERYSRPQLAGGECVGHVCCFRDITERRQAERALRDSEERFRRLAEASSEVFWIFDPQRREILYVSPAFETIWGRSSEDLYQNAAIFLEAIHAEDRAREQDNREHHCRGQATNTEYRVVRADGSIRWVWDRAYPIRNDAGKVYLVTGIAQDITARRQADEQLRQAHAQLLETSRRAGMAEVATGVLHNVGNVLNSVNVSTTLLADQVKSSRGASLGRAVSLLREHEKDLAAFLAADQRGGQILTFLAALNEHLDAERSGLLAEISQLQKNVGHIKDIVAMQQTYARVSGVSEIVKVSDLVEDALRMNASALERHTVQAVRDFSEVPAVTVDKHKVLQILVNLIRNAKYACDESRRPDKQMTVRIARRDERVHIAVEDNGVGIAPQNLNRIFNHGFTTRADGHGFGLHSGALAARDLGGSLSVRSDGPGRGATFTLELPLQPPDKAATKSP